MVIKKHLDWVDYAKGIGIILVVFGHVARGVVNADITINHEMMLLLDQLIYSFHMPLFFFLSGLFFIGSLKKRETSGLIVNKLHTLIYPYLVWSIIQLSLQISLSEYTNFEKSFENIYAFLWQPSDHFWYLYTLFVMFVLYTLVYYMTSSVRSILFLSLLTYFLHELLSTPWSVLNSVYQFGIYFSLGIALSHFKEEHIDKLWLRTVGAIFTFSLAMYLVPYQGMLPSLFMNDLLTLIIAVIAILSVVVFSHLLSKLNVAWIKIVGSYSLEIYLVHIIFGSGFRIIMQYVFGIESGLFHLIFGTLVGIVFSILFVEAVKKAGWLFLFTSPKQLK